MYHSRRQATATKRENEVDDSSIENLKKVIDGLSHSRDELERRVRNLEQLLGAKDGIILTLENDNLNMKRALQCQRDCPIIYSECPIAIKLEQLKA